MNISHKSTVTIRGMHCPSCKTLIEDVAGDTPGVNSCAVDEKTGQATIDYDERLDWIQFGKELARVGPYQIVR